MGGISEVGREGKLPEGRALGKRGRIDERGAAEADEKGASEVDAEKASGFVILVVESEGEVEKLAREIDGENLRDLEKKGTVGRAARLNEESALALIDGVAPVELGNFERSKFAGRWCHSDHSLKMIMCATMDNFIL